MSDYTDTTQGLNITPCDWKQVESLIKVVGVGGAGCNAVTYMHNQGVKGCSFIVCNTDAQALERSSVPVKIQLGHGRLGAGTDPLKGRNAAMETEDRIKELILDNDTQMLFITAGLGGGTGTGAAPVIAELARQKGILTVAVVTMPFSNEGPEALTKAIDGLRSLEKLVDSLIVIKNEKLYDHYGDLLVQDAFPKSDEVLATAVRGITEIISQPGYINVDFEDIKTMMRNSGYALMGCGSGTGEDRLDQAVSEAFDSPLLNEYDLKTARNVLVNITTGKNDQGLKMEQLASLNEKIKEHTGKANNFKRGLVWDEDPDFGDQVRITAIVTGLQYNDILPPGADQGNYICIENDFTYDPSESLEDPDGISLGESTTGQGVMVGSGKRANMRTFHFTEETKPVLILNDGQDRNALERQTAFERSMTKK